MWLHAEHLLNEYCTPEYSSPQLIAAITNLPAPVMDDAANDVWSLGVVLFQMLACTVPGPQVGHLFSSFIFLLLHTSLTVCWPGQDSACGFHQPTLVNGNNLLHDCLCETLDFHICMAVNKICGVAWSSF